MRNVRRLCGQTAGAVKLLLMSPLLYCAVGCAPPPEDAEGKKRSSDKKEEFVFAPAPVWRDDPTVDRQVVTFVRGRGGKVAFADEVPGERVVSIELCVLGIVDDDLKRLASLKHLRRLRLCGNPITDAGVKHFLGLRGLEFLDLHATQVTDEAIKDIATLPALEKLWIGNTRVTATVLGAPSPRCPG